jgi:RNA polymerase sigma factor (sigma-70 family)
MAAGKMGMVLRHLRSALQGEGAERSDGELLSSFVRCRDPAALELLVHRHAPMVWGVCRRILPHHHDAEDAFQATFLVLVRKAASIRPRAAVAGWLYGVARQTALKTRAMMARRKARERQQTAMPEPAISDPSPEPDLQPLLELELSRLPDSYRAAIVLCDLEGKTRREAALQLGCPEGTVGSRLARARAMLARRLARRSLALSGGMLAALLSQGTASAHPPAPVLSAAIKAVNVLATRGAAVGTASARALAVTEGVLKAMLLTKLKSMVLAVAVLGTVALGAAMLAWGSAESEGAGRPPGEGAGRPAAGASARTEGGPVSKPVAEAKDRQYLGAAAGAKIRQPRDGGRPEAAPAELDEVTVVITPSFRSNRPRETVRVSADGTCLYEVPGLPARGETPAWSAARIVHKLPAERLRELNGMLKSTDWLAKAAKERPQMHHDRCEITLQRQGKATRLVLTGQSEPYAKLLTFFRSVAAQEYLIYRLEWVPVAMTEARRELDNLIAAELGEPFARPPLAIDLARYIRWATRQVRNPFDKSADAVRTAVRLVGLLKLESEREYLADLASDRDRRVREAVAQAVGRLGGAKAVPVLRKMVRSTGAEAAWELIRLGPVAVPTIVEVIREGRSPEEDLSYEWLIRAYIEHWKEVPKPLDPKVVDAVRASMAAPEVKALRTYYHAELVKLAARAARKD